MQTINILSDFKDIDNFIDNRLKSFPRGHIYAVENGTNLYSILKPFIEEWYNCYQALNTTLNDIYKIHLDNIFLEEWKMSYKLPNDIFKEINSTQDIVFAITIMKYISLLVSVQDYEGLFALIGYEVKFYHWSRIKAQARIPYKIPMFIYPNRPYNKLTYFIWINTDNLDKISNIPSSIPLIIRKNNNNLSRVKHILDLICPMYIKLYYINNYQKNILDL